MQRSGPLLLQYDRLTFASPSAAAAIVAGRSATGPREWKLIDTRQTYRDWKGRSSKKREPAAAGKPPILDRRSGPLVRDVRALGLGCPLPVLGKFLRDEVDRTRAEDAAAAGTE
jgi:hypothetical protein